MSEFGRAGKVSGGVDARTAWRIRAAMFLFTALMLGLLYFLWGGFRNEVNAAAGILSRGDIEGLRDYILSFGVFAPMASVLLMVLQAIVAPLPSFLITFANGLAFGVLWGWILSLLGHVLAAAVCFGISRALGRAPVEILVGRAGLESADRWFERWGMYAVFAGRLVPGISFDIISYAAGLTRMRFRGFIAATALGVTPQTFLYSFLGRQAPEYVGLFFVTTAIVIVGFVGYVVYRRRRQENRPRRNFR
jgi:uncharacterized membrane protein YdjX (TVP38/TMEM64 family)